jgi:hypothetical protein
MDAVDAVSGRTFDQIAAERNSTADADQSNPGERKHKAIKPAKSIGSGGRATEGSVHKTSRCEPSGDKHG